MTRPADEEISAWSQSTSIQLRIAARLAREIRDGKYDDWRPLPAAINLAAEYDVSPRTACRAKALLAARGDFTNFRRPHRASLSWPRLARVRRTSGPIRNVFGAEEMSLAREVLRGAGPSRAGPEGVGTAATEPTRLRRVGPGISRGITARGMISRHGPCHYASGQPAPAGNDHAPGREKEKVSDERH